MKLILILSLFFISFKLFAVEQKDLNNKNNRKIINLFENQKKVKQSFGGRALAKSQLDDTGRPADEDEIEVEENMKAPHRVINLRDVQKSVFEENKPKAPPVPEKSN